MAGVSECDRWIMFGVIALAVLAGAGCLLVGSPERALICDGVAALVLVSCVAFKSG